MSARRAASWGLLIVVLAAAAVSGCGGSAASSTASRAVPVPPSGSQQAAERASIAIGSSAVEPGGNIASRYTCKGANESIPLEWAGVGPEAKELVVLVRSLGSSLRSANVNWVVAGIAPSVQTIAAGKVPAGAIVGRNSFGQVGYSLCPVKGAARTIVTIKVLAYAQKLALKPGFNVNEIGPQVKGGGVEWGSILANV